MFRYPMRICLFAFLLSVCLLSIVAADEQHIIADVKAFFETRNVTRQAELVRRIKADPAYRRASVGEYLHRAPLFDDLEPGRKRIDVALSEGRKLSVTLRIPKGYSPSRPYPLLYVLHGSGSNARWSIRFGEQLLRDEVDKYVIAAPAGYGPQDFHPCETPAILRTIKKLVHVDSDRVWVTGYSAGGCSSWALAVLQPDEFTAAIPVAGSLYIGPQTPAFLANVAHTYVLNVWGARDNMPGWDADKVGIAESNRRLRAEVERLGLPVDSHEYPDLAHGGVMPPRELLLPALQRRREHHPKQVRHTFQHPCQAKAYWLERNTKQGELAWRRPAPLDLRPGENVNRAIERALDSQRGVLRGVIEGQTIMVDAKNAEEMTVWIGDGMIDWQKPVRVLMDDHEVFNDTIEPELSVCLTQAARTRDFDRLRWAGLIVRGAAPAELVTGATTLRETPDEDRGSP